MYFTLLKSMAASDGMKDPSREPILTQNSLAFRYFRRLESILCELQVAINSIINYFCVYFQK